MAASSTLAAPQQAAGGSSGSHRGSLPPSNRSSTIVQSSTPQASNNTGERGAGEQARDREPRERPSKIRVAVRIRPLLEGETGDSSALVVRGEHHNVLEVTTTARLGLQDSTSTAHAGGSFAGAGSNTADAGAGRASAHHGHSTYGSLLDPASGSSGGGIASARHTYHGMPGGASSADGSGGAKKLQFAVDHVFDSRQSGRCGQAAVYQSFCGDLVKSAVEGYNVCVFAYGHTGTGKTYTMLGDYKRKPAFGVAGGGPPLLSGEQQQLQQGSASHHFGASSAASGASSGFFPSPRGSSHIPQHLQAHGYEKQLHQQLPPGSEHVNPHLLHPTYNTAPLTPHIFGESAGIVPRMFRKLIEQHQENFHFSVKYFEVYLERLRDLLVGYKSGPLTSPGGGSGGSAAVTTTGPGVVLANGGNVGNLHGGGNLMLTDPTAGQGGGNTATDDAVSTSTASKRQSKTSQLEAGITSNLDHAGITSNFFLSNTEYGGGGGLHQSSKQSSKGTQGATAAQNPSYHAAPGGAGAVPAASPPATANAPKPNVHFHPKVGVFVSGVREMLVHSVEDYGGTKCWSLHKEALNCVEYGNRRRSSAATRLNRQSSRSHAIIQLRLFPSKSLNIEDVDMLTARTSCPSSTRAGAKDAAYTLKSVGLGCMVTLVDLAGREQEKKIIAEYQNNLRTRETQFINKSLFHLSHCIQKLVVGGGGGAAEKAAGETNSVSVLSGTPRRPENAEASKSVDFRNSKLTLLLTDALTGNSKTVLLGTISHEKTLMEDTVATLRFCTNVRQVTTQPRISEHTSHQALVKSLEQEVIALRGQLQQAQTGKERMFEELDKKEQMYQYYKASSDNLIHQLELYKRRSEHHFSPDTTSPRLRNPSSGAGGGGGAAAAGPTGATSRRRSGSRTTRRSTARSPTEQGASGHARFVSAHHQGVGVSCPSFLPTQDRTSLAAVMTELKPLVDEANLLTERIYNTRCKIVAAGGIPQAPPASSQQFATGRSPGGAFADPSRPIFLDLRVTVKIPGGPESLHSTQPSVGMSASSSSSKRPENLNNGGGTSTAAPGGSTPGFDFYGDMQHEASHSESVAESVSNIHHSLHQPRSKSNPKSARGGGEIIGSRGWGSGTSGGATTAPHPHSPYLASCAEATVAVVWLDEMLSGLPPGAGRCGNTKNSSRRASGDEHTMLEHPAGNRNGAVDHYEEHDHSSSSASASAAGCSGSASASCSSSASSGGMPVALWSAEEFLKRLEAMRVVAADIEAGRLNLITGTSSAASRSSPVLAACPSPALAAVGVAQRGVAALLQPWATWEQDAATLTQLLAQQQAPLLAPPYTTSFGQVVDSRAPPRPSPGAPSPLDHLLQHPSDMSGTEHEGLGFSTGTGTANEPHPTSSDREDPLEFSEREIALRSQLMQCLNSFLHEKEKNNFVGVRALCTRLKTSLEEDFWRTKSPSKTGREESRPRIQLPAQELVANHIAQNISSGHYRASTTTTTLANNHVGAQQANGGAGGGHPRLASSGRRGSAGSVAGLLAAPPPADVRRTGAVGSSSTTSSSSSSSAAAGGAVTVTHTQAQVQVVAHQAPPQSAPHQHSTLSTPVQQPTMIQGNPRSASMARSPNSEFIFQNFATCGEQLCNGVAPGGAASVPAQKMNYTAHHQQQLQLPQHHLHHLAKQQQVTGQQAAKSSSYAHQPPPRGDGHASMTRAAFLRGPSPLGLHQTSGAPGMANNRGGAQTTMTSPFAARGSPPTTTHHFSPSPRGAASSGHPQLQARASPLGTRLDPAPVQFVLNKNGSTISGTSTASSSSNMLYQQAKGALNGRVAGAHQQSPTTSTNAGATLFPPAAGQQFATARGVVAAGAAPGAAPSSISKPPTGMSMQQPPQPPSASAISSSRATYPGSAAVNAADQPQRQTQYQHQLHQQGGGLGSNLVSPVPNYRSVVMVPRLHLQQGSQAGGGPQQQSPQLSSRATVGSAQQIYQQQQQMELQMMNKHQVASPGTAGVVVNLSTLGQMNSARSSAATSGIVPSSAGGGGGTTPGAGTTPLGGPTPAGVTPAGPTPSHAEAGAINVLASMSAAIGAGGAAGGSRTYLSPRGVVPSAGVGAGGAERERGNRGIPRQGSVVALTGRESVQSVGEPL